MTPSNVHVPESLAGEGCQIVARRRQERAGCGDYGASVAVDTFALLRGVEGLTTVYFQI